MRVDPSYFPDHMQETGGYQDSGAVTFRNLNDVARRGLDIALRGGSSAEVKEEMRQDLDRKRHLGFDMDFENYLMGKLETEIRKAND